MDRINELLDKADEARRVHERVLEKWGVNEPSHNQTIVYVDNRTITYNSPEITNTNPSLAEVGSFVATIAAAVVFGAKKLL